MEELVVSFETAKRLKEAGFLQKLESVSFAYCQGHNWHETELQLIHEDNDTNWTLGNDYSEKPNESWISAPTAQELVDQLPKPIALNIYSDGRVSVSHAGENDFIKSVPKEVSMTEALAHLWLKLHE